MVLVALPPTIDSPQDFCFCGRETVETHDFLFCSTECARHDSLRSLGDPNCHYRNVVRDAYVRAGTPELQPRRMASAVHLRPGPSVHRIAVSPPPPFMSQTALAQQRNANLERIAPWTKYEAFLPTPSGTVPDRKATAGELAAGKHDQSRRPVFANVPSRAHPLPRPGDHTFGMNTPTVRTLRSFLSLRSSHSVSDYLSLCWSLSRARRSTFSRMRPLVYPRSAGQHKAIGGCGSAEFRPVPEG